MKITIPKLFESFQLGADAAKLDPLVSFINGAIEQVVKALQGRLTLRDNAFSEIRSLEFKDTGPGPWIQTFTPAQRTVEGIIILQTEAADDNTVESWRYKFLANGTIEIAVYPRVASALPITIKFVTLFQ